VGRTTNYTWFCGYLLGFVVDGLHQVITAVAWGVGNIKQCKLFKPGLKAHIERLGKPKAVAADSAFDAPEVHAYLDKEEIVGNITSRDHAPASDGGYGTDRVVWGEGADQPLCPNQKPLIAKGQRHKNGGQTYEGSACAGCPVYERCNPKGEGQPKRFTLHPDEHRRWQENRAHCQTDGYKEAHRERFVAEGRFGLAKTNHHGAKAPYRRDKMNRIAGLMIAIVMNCRILVRQRQNEGRAT